MLALKYNLVYIIFSLIFLVPRFTDAQNYTWTQKANYGGGAIYDPFSFTIGSKAYVGTGRSVQPTILRTDFWEYDPITNIWTQKASFPGSGRYGARGFSIGNLGYAGTGWDPSPKSDFFKYDPQTNSWSAMPSFGGSGRYTGVSFSIDNSGYLGLGYAPCKNDFWKFDATLNSWSQIATFPGASRQNSSAFVINNFAYVGLGVCPGSLYNDFYRYNPFTNTWNQVASLPAGGRCAAYSFTINLKGIIAMGCTYNGLNPQFSILNEVWQYDPTNDSWLQLLNFPGTRVYNGIWFGLDNKGYVGAGTDTIVASTHYSDEFWEYSPDSTTSLNEAELNSIEIYPNPANNYISIVTSPSFGKSIITLCDISGQEIQSIKSENENIFKHTFDISNLSSGVYFLKAEGKSTYVKKFVKY